MRMRRKRDKRGWNRDRSHPATQILAAAAEWLAAANLEGLHPRKVAGSSTHRKGVQPCKVAGSSTQGKGMQPCKVMGSRTQVKGVPLYKGMGNSTQVSSMGEVSDIPRKPALRNLAWINKQLRTAIC
eukprot:1139344-Pelagomonas_calceolata.AAC.2